MRANSPLDNGFAVDGHTLFDHPRSRQGGGQSHDAHDAVGPCRAERGDEGVKDEAVGRAAEAAAGEHDAVGEASLLAKVLRRDRGDDLQLSLASVCLSVYSVGPRSRPVFLRYLPQMTSCKADHPGQCDPRFHNKEKMKQKQVVNDDVPHTNSLEHPRTEEQAANVIDRKPGQNLTQPHKRSANNCRPAGAELGHDGRVGNGQRRDEGRLEGADERQRGGARQVAVDESRLHDTPGVSRAERPPELDGAGEDNDPAVAALGHLRVGEARGLKNRVGGPAALPVVAAAIGGCCRCRRALGELPVELGELDGAGGRHD